MAVRLRPSPLPHNEPTIVPLFTHMRGSIVGMKATVDKAGRVVIPKSIRERNRLVPGTEIEILDFGDHIELILPDDRPRAVLKKKNGKLVISAESGRRETMEETLALIDELRESRLR